MCMWSDAVALITKCGVNPCAQISFTLIKSTIESSSSSAFDLLAFISLIWITFFLSKKFLLISTRNERISNSKMNTFLSAIPLIKRSINCVQQFPLQNETFYDRLSLTIDCILIFISLFYYYYNKFNNQLVRWLWLTKFFDRNVFVIPFLRVLKMKHPII